MTNAEKMKNEKEQENQTVNEEVENENSSDDSAEVEEIEKTEEKELTPEEEIAVLKDKNLRLLAEMQNVRARHQKDLKDTREYAVSGFANDVIGISENVYRAKESIPTDDGDEKYTKILDGVGLIIEEMKKVFDRHDIERIDPKKGDKFDYKFHQAMVQVPTNEQDEGTIVDLINAGYTLKERVLRPAMVAVAKKVEVVDEAKTESKTNGEPVE